MDDGVVLESFTWLEPDLDGQDKELKALLARLDQSWQDSLKSCDRPLQELVEIFLQLGRRPKAIFDDGIRKDSVYLTHSECCERWHLDKFMESMQWREHIRNCNSKCICIPETLHRISMITKGEGSELVLIGLNVRVGRSVVGSVSQMCPWLTTGKQFLGKEGYPSLNLGKKSILLIGRPGVGKTTILREIAYYLSSLSDDGILSDKTVVVVDKINEIAGNNDMPHPCIGEARWMPCGNPDHQSKILREAIQNTTPDVVLVDEISDAAEVEAARTIIERGVSLIATVHGNFLTDILTCSTRHVLLGGLRENRRLFKPPFDVVIEIHYRDTWILHPNVQRAVDRYLHGHNLQAIELRPGLARAAVGVALGGAWDYCLKCAANTCSLHESSSGQQFQSAASSKGFQKPAPQTSHSSSSPYRQIGRESFDRATMRSLTPKRKKAPPAFGSSAQRTRTPPGESRAPKALDLAGIGSSKAFAESRTPPSTNPQILRRTPRSNQVMSERRQRLTLEELDHIGARIKAATYAMNSHQVDVYLNRLNHERSGCMQLEDLRRGLRKYFKISPSIVTDFDLDELCAAIGDDVGMIGIRDFKEFIGLDITLSNQMASTPRNFAASAGSSAYTSDVSPWRAESQKILPLPGGNLLTVFKKRGPIPPEEAVEYIRSKLTKEAQSNVGGRYLSSVIARFDRDGTGRLQDEEVRVALRRGLKVSPASISDSDIYSACAAIDTECEGSVRIEDLVAFIGGSGFQRDGRR